MSLALELAEKVRSNVHFAEESMKYYLVFPYKKTDLSLITASIVLFTRIEYYLVKYEKYNLLLQKYYLLE